MYFINFKKYIIFFSCVLFFYCKKNETNSTIQQTVSKSSVIKKHPLKETVTSLSKKEIGEWKLYNELNEHISKFTKTSTIDALNNAVELTNLVKKVKDSVKPKALQTEAFSARINVLENEALRLKDMIHIRAITDEQVHQQITKIIDAFAATNSKINTVYQQITLEKNITITTEVIGIDTLISEPKPLPPIKEKKYK